MAETFTPAGCGGRTRRIVALVAFTAAAVAAAGIVGALLGFAGASVPRQAALGIGIAVVALALMREAGIHRIPVPERRWQVPEPWRREKPLLAWSAGYGALLGSGVATHQPTATFWAVCAGTFALADAAVGAACLALHGVGRVIAIVAPGNDPLGRLVRTQPIVRPMNLAALAVCVALLVPSVATAGAPLPSGQSDPAVSGRAIAYADQANGVSNVVVHETGGQPIVFPNGKYPAIDGDTLAYVDDRGIRVVFWRTGQEVGRIDGPFTTPAISGPRIAFVERAPTRRRLIVRNISTGLTRVIASVGPGRDLGRPSYAGQIIAWHVSAGDQNEIYAYQWNTRRLTRLIAARRSQLHVNPVVLRGNVVWVHGNGERSTLLQRHVVGGPVRQIASVLGPRYLYWNTAIDNGRVYVTRVTVNPNTSVINAFRWTPLPPPRSG